MSLLLALAAIFSSTAASGMFLYPVTSESDFYVFLLPRDNSSLAVVCDPENPKTVRQWRAETGAAAVFNGGFFDENLQPLGFTKTDSDLWGSPGDHPAFLAVSLSGASDLLARDETPSSDVRFAVSGFPILVWDGKTRFSNETGKRDRRTVVGIKGDRFYVFVSSRGQPTLAESALALERFGVDRALNLDGGTSTGFSSEYVEVYSIGVPCAVTVNR